ncbi:hypothetical protein AB1E18_011121 [Capra hircus]
METPNAINDNPSWHLADSLSLDAWKVIPMTTVKQILRETDNEFKLRYQQTFSDLTSQLHITPGTAYQSFEQEMYELFRDGNGGWNTFVKLYGNNTAAKSQKGQGRFNRWSLIGMTSAGIALLGSLFSS